MQLRGILIGYKVFPVNLIAGLVFKWGHIKVTWCDHSKQTRLYHQFSKLRSPSDVSLMISLNIILSYYPYEKLFLLRNGNAEFLFNLAKYSFAIVAKEELLDSKFIRSFLFILNFRKGQALPFLFYYIARYVLLYFISTTAIPWEF